MHITTLPIDRSEDCDKFFKKVIKKNITDSFFCAGYPKRRKDACFPDRGDPFMVKVRKHWVIVGITLINMRCKRPHALDIYVRVAFFLEWIKSTIEKYNKNCLYILDELNDKVNVVRFYFYGERCYKMNI
uniref:Peptidase S1 domain-containing protein n=1 Tax=Tetranychus urticae TaxID=32264 RepID=T1L592_TETUR